MKRPLPFWVIVVLLGILLVSLLLGQTMALVNYDLAVRMGLQERAEEISPFGVQVNRAFGVGDTLVYAPLVAASLVGLLLRKRWALLTAAAAMAVTAYVASTCIAMLIFLRGAPGYAWVPGVEVWTVLGIYFVFAVWGFFYVMFRGDRLIVG